MESKAKEPWVAVFLNQLFPGLGYFYTHNRLKAAIVISVAIILICLAIFGILSFAYNDTVINSNEVLVILAAFFGFNILFTVFVLLDGFICARKYNIAAGAKPNNIKLRVLAIMGFLFIYVTGGFSIIPAIYIRTNIIQMYKIPTQNMVPILSPNDKIIVDKRAYLKELPQRGDVINFLRPDERKKLYISRIVGLPGEKLLIEKGHVRINGKELTDSRIAVNYYYNQGDFAQKNKEVIIPSDRYFVLGDNSIAALDSRFWGFVIRKDIKGKVIKIYWPFERSGKVK